MQQRARRIARGGGAIFATSLLIKGSSVLASILIARVLGPFQLGEWALVTYVTGFVYMFIEMGTGTASVRMISAVRVKDPSRAEAFARTYVMFELVVSLPVLLVLTGLAPWLAGSFYRDPVLLPLFWLSVVTMFLWTISACYSAILQAYERIRFLAKLSLCFGLTSSFLLVLFVLLWGLVGGFTASLIANAIQLVVYIIVLRQPRLFSRASLSFDRSILKELLFYGLPTFGAAAFLVTFNWMGATVVTSTAGLQNLGNYTVAQRLAFVIMYIPTAIVVPFFPMASGLYEKDPVQFSRTFNHTLRYTLMIVFPTTLAFSAFARPLITFLYTDAYQGASEVLPIMAGAALLASFMSPANLAYYITGAMWRQVVLSVAVFAVSLVALFSLVPVLGVLGFAWSVYLFYASTVLFAPWLLGRYFPEPRFRRMAAVSMSLSGVIIVSGLVLASLDVKTSAIIGVVLVVVSLLVIYVKVMTTGDRSFVRQMVREVLHLGR
jgi:O-antigen/teichoic acid export membrane protein